MFLENNLWQSHCIAVVIWVTTYLENLEKSRNSKRVRKCRGIESGNGINLGKSVAVLAILLLDEVEIHLLVHLGLLVNQFMKSSKLPQNVCQICLKHLFDNMSVLSI